MNGKELFNGMNHVSESLVAEAAGGKISRPGRKLGRIFLIAAILSVSATVVFAAAAPGSASEWFFAFFGYGTTQEAEQALTDNQSIILDAGLTQINQSVTCNGFTITLESGICDGYKALIKCRVDAPEEISLNGINHALYFESHIDFPGSCTAGSYTGYPLADEDPNDNSISVLLDIIVQPSEDSSFSLADGSEWGFSFSGISELTGSGEDLTWNTLCEGSWEFKVVFDDNLLVAESTELLSKPVNCLWSFHVWGRKIPVSAKIFSFELRSLSATIRYKRPLISAVKGVYFDRPIYLVLKDGTKVRVEIKMTTRLEDCDETLCHFDRPISPEDVAYIEFPGPGQVAVANKTEP